MDLSRSARIGALAWIVAAPLFLTANLITGLGWHHPPYSWATNKARTRLDQSLSH